MFIIYPKFGNKRIRQSIYSQLAVELKGDSADQGAIYINTLDQNHVEKVAAQVAKDNPGIEILISRVQTILSCPPGKIKTLKLNELGEIIPA